MTTAEPLNDFETHLETGINELRSSDGNNLLIFYNEMSQFNEINSSECLIKPQSASPIPTTFPILSTIPKTENLMDQISTLKKTLTKLERHPLGTKGVYHILGLVKFCALKWLNKIRKD